jgi:hypothetical protein
VVQILHSNQGSWFSVLQTGRLFHRNNQDAIRMIKASGLLDAAAATT